MADPARMTTNPAVSVVPANQASCDDLQAVLGGRDPSRCQCQRYKMRPGVRPRSAPRNCPAGCASRRTAVTRARRAGSWPTRRRACRVARGRAPQRLPAPAARLPRPLRGPGGGQDRRQRLGRDLLRHAGGLPAPRRQPCARARRRRLRPRAALAPSRATRCSPSLGRRSPGASSTSAAAASSPPPDLAEVGRPTRRRLVMRIDFSRDRADVTRVVVHSRNNTSQCTGAL